MASTGSSLNGEIPDPTPEADDDNVPLVEITENADFATYFFEHDGRLFHSLHSHGNLPYPLPVDTPEQERLQIHHRALRDLLGRNFVGPVNEILDVTSPGRARQRRVLDLCTGSGTWTIQMAQEFPHVRFHGVDIVPIQTRYPPPNVDFEMSAVGTGPLRWQDDTFDIVHARDISMTVISNNVPLLIQEIARVLRPGGLFISGEWGYYASFDNIRVNPQDVPNIVPGIHNFFEAVKSAMAQRRLVPLSPLMPGLINDAGFTDVRARHVSVPIGSWHPNHEQLGRAFRRAWGRSFSKSVIPLLRSAGWSETSLEAMITRYLYDLRTHTHLVANYHTVHARKM